MQLVFLQNAWFHRPLPYKVGSDKWMRVWRYALALSRSGQRLKLLLGDDFLERDDLVVTETTWEVAYGHSSGKKPPDLDHIAAELVKHKPSVVICCGQQAAESVAPLWHGPLFAVPHPANRILTNHLYLSVGAMLKRPTERYPFGGRVLVTQLRDKRIKYEPLPIAAEAAA